jgi:hypothetical protein
VTPDEVLIYLRRRGVTVHLVVRDSTDDLTIYLEATLGQIEFVEELMTELPQVEATRRVTSGILRAIRKR